MTSTGTELRKLAKELEHLGEVVEDLKIKMQVLYERVEKDRAEIDLQLYRIEHELHDSVAGIATAAADAKRVELQKDMRNIAVDVVAKKTQSLWNDLVWASRQHGGPAP